mmetsp:Transcript_18882/g.33547  ORF Transcript_18882/g.33547 Transcript_18882/m.33547 type:complete len:82 (-) Transcript_18882:191-436(-)
MFLNTSTKTPKKIYSRRMSCGSQYKSHKCRVDSAIRLESTAHSFPFVSLRSLLAAQSGTYAPGHLLRVGSELPIAPDDKRP